jgi:hypothetical protein
VGALVTTASTTMGMVLLIARNLNAGSLLIAYRRVASRTNRAASSSRVVTDFFVSTAPAVSASLRRAWKVAVGVVR